MIQWIMMMHRKTSESTLIARLLHHDSCKPPWTPPRRSPKHQPHTTHSPGWTSWMPGLGCITIHTILFIIIASSVLVSVQVHLNHRACVEKGGTFSLRPTYSFEDMFNVSMQPKVYHTHWLQGSTYSHVEKNGSLISRNVKTKESVLLVNSTLMNGTIHYVISDDTRYVLMAYETKADEVPAFQVSKYRIYDRKNDVLIPFPNDERLKDTWLNSPPSFIPPNNALVFVSGNNMFYQRNPLAPAEQVTTSGRHNVIYNGVTDPTYHDILGGEQAYWVSADGRYLAYLQLNCSGMPLQDLPAYGSSSFSSYSHHDRSFPYSEAGNTENRRQTTARVLIVDTADLEDKHVIIEPPAQLANRDHYVVRVSWREKGAEGKPGTGTVGSDLVVMWSNRPQNHTVTSICTLKGRCRLNHEEMVVGGWIEPWPPVMFIHEGKAYLTILLKPEAETGEWPHIAMITMPTDRGGEVVFITGGQEVVTSIEAFDEAKQHVYYITTAGDPKRRFLHRLDISDPLVKNKAHKPECLSCNLTPNCTYASVTFSVDSTYYNLHCEGPGIPYNMIKSTDGTTSELVEDNSELSSLLGVRDLPRTGYYYIELGEGYKGWAKILIPPESDRDQDRKWYPVIFESPSEPGGEYVDERFSLGLPEYLASTHNLVYVRVDGRGTAGRGARYKHQMYRRFATADVDDQMLAARWMTTARHVTDKLLTNLRIADKKRFAIWGSGYGGLLALHALANASSPFACAVVAGALSDMRFLSPLEAERYMGYALTTDNQAAYEISNIINKVDLLRNKRLLVTHGTDDYKVPFSSSAYLMAALHQADIQHTHHIYPDMSNDEMMKSRHFHRLLIDYLNKDCFELDDSY